MKIIKKIFEKIEKELDCSEDYIRIALIPTQDELCKKYKKRIRELNFC